MPYLSQLRETVEFLRNRLGPAPAVAIVLGSGLGTALSEKVECQRLHYGDIPHFPISSVVGHAGELVWGEYSGSPFCALSGRVHVYEGLSPERIVFAVRALSLWGVPRFIVTNAAGAIRQEFSPGDLMLITDHINLQGDNPLCGDNFDDLGPRFPDMSQAYDRNLIRIAREAAQDLGLTVREGVYIAVRGPSYETPAEIRMCRTLGADAVGMSTVPETIALKHMGRRVLGISCLTNMAAGVLPQPLIHDEVLEVTKRVQGDFSRLILEVTRRIADR